MGEHGSRGSAAAMCRILYIGHVFRRIARCLILPEIRTTSTYTLTLLRSIRHLLSSSALLREWALNEPIVEG